MNEFNLKDVINNSPTFCALPFMHSYLRANGGITPCCESQETGLMKNHPEESFADTWNGAKFRQLRQDLLDGKRPNSCQKCWYSDDNGVLSKRQQSVGIWQEDGFYDIFVTDSMHVSKMPGFFELKTNNFCNFACKMCSPTSSHKIGERIPIFKKWGIGTAERKPLQINRKFIDEFIASNGLGFDNLRRLQFSGGEPLLSQEHYDLLEFLIDSGMSRSIHLRYSTNLSHLTYKDVNLWDLWSNFQHVCVKVSIDGIYDVYDYIRVGGNFDTLAENLATLVLHQKHLPQLELMFDFTTQVMNVFQLPEFFVWMCEGPLKQPEHVIKTNFAYWPEPLDCAAFPTPMKSKIIDKLAASPYAYRFEGIRNYLAKNDFSDRWPSTLGFIADLEQQHPYQHTFSDLLERYL